MKQLDKLLANPMIFRILMARTAYTGNLVITNLRFPTQVANSVSCMCGQSHQRKWLRYIKIFQLKILRMFWAIMLPDTKTFRTKSRSNAKI